MTNYGLIGKYFTSYALIIGINNYRYNSPLDYAVSDAEAVARILQEKFGFTSNNIFLLCDKRATRASILKYYLSLTSNITNINDRVFVYFAGHGYTVNSRRGDVGYLIPFDGNVDKLDSLIRWDELTRNADLIAAKHVLFVMDACYGGLAITRALQPGSMRFIKDMLLRFSRQVITAGKADEVVADFGGPLPNHSIFTGHFLEALSGKSSFGNGIITANGFMAYVYRMVGHDPYSHQTPHFGYLDGDGDFIFSAPILNSEQPVDEKIEQDILFSIPSLVTEETYEEKMNLIEQVKEFLSDTRYKIKLHDLVTQKTRELLSVTSIDGFPVQGGWSNEEFLDRLKRYEVVTSDILTIEILISFWGHDDCRDMLIMPARRLSNNLGPMSGNVGLISLQWYPILLLTYSAGISAVAGERYENLFELFHFETKDTRGRNSSLIMSLFGEISKLNDSFKIIPGHERQYVPRSEYLYKLLQPIIDDILFLGSDYESVFDKFEVLLALEFAHINMKENNRLWGPPGRFAWKYRNHDEYSLINTMLIQAEAQGNSWLPIKAGFFDRSFERFKEIVVEYKKLMSEFNYY